MADIISELYFGNIHPFDRSGGLNAQEKEILDLITRHEEGLAAQLDNAGNAVLQKLIDCYSDMDTIIAHDKFCEGFILGAKLIMEICQAQSHE